MIKKIIIVIFLVLLLNSCGSSGSTNDGTSGNNDSGGIKDTIDEILAPKTVYNNKETGNEVLKHSNDLDVYFLDINNQTSNDGLDFERMSDGKNMLKSCDSYLVKSGNIELLVDCGFQAGIHSSPTLNNKNEFEFYDESITNNFQNNLIKKIATICDDGVLDYLVITHADFDHIASLIVKDGLLDSFYNNKIVKNLKNNDVELKEIKNIIDFDSPMINLHSYINIVKEKRLIQSDYYQCYLYKRNKLIEKGSNYLPASSLFQFDEDKSEDEKNKIIQNILENKKNDVKQELSYYEKQKALPDKVKSKLLNTHRKDLSKFILDEYNPNNAALPFKDKVLKNKDYVKSVELLNGELKYDNGFYYSIPFGKAELDILYNWHYDYIFHSSFNENNKNDDTVGNDTDHSYNSQDANNISVCLMVKNRNFKFLTTGDLGGNGEEALYNYYKNSSLINKVTLYRASHHGSTTNGENSEKLLKILTPKIVCITGCAQEKLDPPGYSSTNAMIGSPKVKKELIDRILKSNPNCYILCTTIACADNLTYKDFPFYGDIHISYNNHKNYISNSYIGKIRPHINRDFYLLEENKNYYFTVRDSKNNLISYQNTDWYKKINILKGEK